MELYFEEFKDEIDELILFLTSDTWTFYGTPNPKADAIRKNYESNKYSGDDCKTFWVNSAENNKIGMIRIYDLQDRTPLLDIRILNKYKGMGVGTTTINWVVDFIFNNFSDKERIEANTRQDNYAMRSVCHKCGFVKEAHYRKAWPGQYGKIYDAVGYSITKEDWINKEVTPLNWNDFKY